MVRAGRAQQTAHGRACVREPHALREAEWWVGVATSVTRGAAGSPTFSIFHASPRVRGACLHAPRCTTARVFRR